MNLYMVFIKDGVINSDCYVQGGNYFANSDLEALEQFNQQYGYLLNRQQVTIREV